MLNKNDLAHSRCPYIPEGLMAWLDARFPSRCPSMGDTDRAIWAAVGARSVIELLLRESDDQQETTLHSVGQ